MKTRFNNLLVAALLALGMMLGGGMPHLMSAGMTGHHGSASVKPSSQCLSACSILPADQYKSPAFDEKDDDRGYFPFALVPFDAYYALLSSILLAAALLAYLRQRPPDLTLELGTWRN